MYLKDLIIISKIFLFICLFIYLFICILSFVL